MKIGTWNEKDNPDLPAWMVVEDAREMADWFTPGAYLLGLQEFAEHADRQAALAAFGPSAALAGHLPECATPILYNTARFRMLATDYVRAHGGKAGVSPHRGWQWGLFDLIDTDTDPFDVFATHFVSKRWLSVWRMRQWRRHRRLLSAALLDHPERGKLILGDFNVRNPPKLHPRQVVLAHEFVDAVIWIPPTADTDEDATLVKRGQFLVKLHSDHDGVGVRARLRR